MELTHKQRLAVEVLSSNLEINQKQLAQKMGVNRKTIQNWMTDPIIIDAIYKRYMEVAGRELPGVINAMIREAKEGNVQAGRLILEHFGKLDSRVKLHVESPWEQYMKIEGIQDAEFTDNSEVTKEAISIGDQASDILSNISVLSNRNASNDNPALRKRNENKRIELATQSEKKKAKVSEVQHNMYQRRQRAKKVGLELLKAGRHPKGVREEWWDKLEKLEIEKFGEIQGERC